MKSQIRQDMETRVSKGTTPSQQLRHALYELWKLDGEADAFDIFYVNFIHQKINEVLDQAEIVKNNINK